MKAIGLLCLLLCLEVAYAQEDGPQNRIADDVVENYGRVKEILHQFYRDTAKQYGHDYDPLAVQDDVEHAACADDSEICANKHVAGDLFENDIVLTLPQAEKLLEDSHKRGKRQAQSTPDSFWVGRSIPYSFSGSDSGWQDLIRSALRHVESQTCMRFVEGGPGSDRLLYFRGAGCWSNVGKIGGRQQVSIGYGCDALGIIAHETLHALGLWHEQSRTDRDSFVFINPSAIIRGTQGNFQKRSADTTDNMNQPYDIGSVMHYGSKAFSKDYRTYTIQARDPRYQRTMGQREQLSFKDAKMINLRYCQDVCSRKLDCYNGGYTDPNDCWSCRCPPGYGGRYCEQRARKCGEELQAVASQKTLESGNVYESTDCVWRIRAERGKKIELNFEKVNFVCEDACESYVEVKYASDKTKTGARLCCDAQRTNILSEDNDVILIFKGFTGMQVGYQGFIVKYRSYGSTSTLATGSPKGATEETSAPETVQPTTAPTTTTPSTTPSTTTPTTTTPSTTRRPTTTTRSVGYWSGWSEWSRCTEPCGGCGRRRRQRACYGGGSCSGYPDQIQPCNPQVCTNGKTGHICNGRVVIPCELAAQLHFGTSNKEALADNALPSVKPLPNLLAPKPLENPFLRRSKRALPTGVSHMGSRGTQSAAMSMCEKRFTYYCPSRLLTIHIDWLRATDVGTKQDSPRCCTGYYASGDRCYKNPGA